MAILTKEKRAKELKLEELRKMLASSEVLKDPKQYAELSREYKKLEQLVRKYREQDKLAKEIEGVHEMLSSAESELRDVAQKELEVLEGRLSAVENAIEDMSNPYYEEFQKNCIVEIRAGAGGDEASLFAADLFRMYQKYVEYHRFKSEVLSSHPSEIGGFKEIIFLVSGKNAYRLFRYEKGVHRVQKPGAEFILQPRLLPYYQRLKRHSSRSILMTYALTLSGQEVTAGRMSTRFLRRYG
jgi:peptide chain release factor 1